MNPVERTPRRTPGASLFVWGLWTLLFLIALAFVGKWGRNIPIKDDYALIPALTGNEPDLGGWLWKQHFEHREPLPKAIALGLLKATGGDFRSGMFFNAFALGMLSFAMIRAAGILRGRTICADAVFPLALLHLGHGDNLLHCWEICFVLPTALVGILLLIIVLRGGRLTLGAAALFGVCLVALPLCGPIGLAFVPPMALWLGVESIQRWRSQASHERRTAPVLWALAAAPLLVMGLYFLDYRKPSHDYPNAGVWTALRAGTQLLSMIFGLPARRLWPLSGLVALGLASIGGGLLAAAWGARPGERSRILGLLAFMAGLACLAAGFGSGRGGAGDDYIFQTRFVTLSVPFVCWAYLVAVIYGPSRRNLVVSALLIGMCFIYIANLRGGAGFARMQGGMLAALERDLRGGMPLHLLVNRYATELWPTYPDSGIFVSSHDILAGCLCMLRRANIGPFVHLRQAPRFLDVPIPVAPPAISRTTRGGWEGGRANGADMQVSFDLPRAMYVAGMRITIDYSTAPGHRATFRLSWDPDGPGGPAEPRSIVDDQFEAGPGERTATFWICDEVSRLSIIPDREPCTFRISELSLLVPIEGDRPADR